MQDTQYLVYVYVGAVVLFLLIIYLIFGRRKQKIKESIDHFAFAENLKFLRISNKMTTEQLAKQINLSSLVLETMESKLIQPSIDQLIKIASFFQVEVKELVFKSMIDEYNTFIYKNK